MEVAPSSATSQDFSGDLPNAEFRAALHRAADMIADYLAGVERFPVAPRVKPGEIRAALPSAPPEHPEPLRAALDDFERLIAPNTTHWNHPGFMAYFAISGSAPGIIGELLTAGLNINHMLWRTGPAATELEELACDWLRQMIDLPPEFRGHINDTASIGSMLGIAAARERQHDLQIRARGLAANPDAPRLIVYCSQQAHSSIDKAMITLGLGLENLRKISTDRAFRMNPDALETTIRLDRAAGFRPIAIVATAGTTSTTSVDPLRAVAAIARKYDLWLHVDAAYAGSAAICPEFRALLDGLEEADSIVVNPHKWLFTPVDCSVLFLRDPDALRNAFSLVPDYLKTTDGAATNLMDYGPQLGRRFRSLKLWMVIRAFGVEGLRQRIRYHCQLARDFRARLAADPRFEVSAPTPFSAVCFRAVPPVSPPQQDAFNESLLAEVNADGSVLLSPTKLNDRVVLRLTIGNIRTRAENIETAWRLLVDAATRLWPR